MTTFDHLPTEILRQIARNLPPRSAFNLLFVCRRIRDSYVYDGAVWRDIVASKLQPLTSFSIFQSLRCRDMETIRNCRPQSRSNNKPNHREPHQVAVPDDGIAPYTAPIVDFKQRLTNADPILLTIEPRELYPFSDPINHTADDTTQALTNPLHPIGISRNGKLEVPIEIWRSSQAASFCLSSRLLTYHLSAFASEKKAQESLKRFLPLLYTIPWFFLDFSDPNILDPFNGYRMARLGFMMHTFANRAAGYFPPTVLDIPFSSFMKLLAPFHKDFL
jgi:hypothetical protein